MRDQLEIQPNDCKGEITLEPISEMVADRMQDRSTIHPDVITGEECEAHRPSNHQANQKIPITNEGAHEGSSHHHESGVLFAKDVGQHVAVLPEVDVILSGVKIDDIQVGDPGVPLTNEQENLCQLIWKKRRLLMGKENSLPPAARGVICDSDVGEATPIAQRVRPVAPKFRKRLADLIKGLLLATIICPSTSPWMSPIVVIVKKNGVDI